MDLIVLVPKVIENYISQFPETTNNALNYFNYDNRVVEERVNRNDKKEPYKGPEDLTNQDYDSLVTYAKSIMNPMLVKYSVKVAVEDALNIAVKSFAEGLFDGKINADKFKVLCKAMEMPAIICAKKKAEPDKILKHHILRQLGIKPKDIGKNKKVPKGVPHLIKTDKGIVIKK